MEFHKLILACCLPLLLAVLPACASKPDLNDPVVINDLIYQMRFGSEQEHRRARGFLLEAGERAVPQLVKDLLESNAVGREHGIGYTMPLLEEIGTANGETIDYIIDRLNKSGSAAEIRTCLALLVTYKVPAQRELPLIEPFMGHEDASVSAYAALRYWEISGDVRPLLEKTRSFLNGSDSFLRTVALRSIKGKLKEDAAPLLPEVIALLQPGNDEAELVIEAIGAIGPAAAEALPLLEGIAAEPNSSLASSAQLAIESIRADKIRE